MEQLRQRADAGQSGETCPGCAAPAEASRCSSCGAALHAGAYRILKVLEQSPHGRMYLAEDAGGRQVALKELVFALVPDVQQLEAFEREAKLLATLSHPQIPKLLASFREGAGVHTRLYLAQELVPGESLQARMEHHRFDAAEAVDIARQVLKLLGYLHGLTPQVLHRDLKPANLILRPDGTLALVDFGSARDLLTSVTHGATLVGTFGYMPPEQLGGTVDARSDLYALGATLVHLLSRRAPSELVSGSLGLDFARHVKVEPHFLKFLQKLLAPRPDARFASAQEALAYLELPGHRRPLGARALVYAGLLAAAGLAFATLFPQTFEFATWARSYLPSSTSTLSGMRSVHLRIARELTGTGLVSAEVVDATRSSDGALDLVTVKLHLTNRTSELQPLSQAQRVLRSVHLKAADNRFVSPQNLALTDQNLAPGEVRELELVFSLDDPGPAQLVLEDGAPIVLPKRP